MIKSFSYNHVQDVARIEKKLIHIVKQDAQTFTITTHGVIQHLARQVLIYS